MKMNQFSFSVGPKSLTVGSKTYRPGETVAYDIVGGIRTLTTLLKTGDLSVSPQISPMMFWGQGMTAAEALAANTDDTPSETRSSRAQKKRGESMSQSE